MKKLFLIFCMIILVLFVQGCTTSQREAENAQDNTSQSDEYNSDNDTDNIENDNSDVDNNESFSDYDNYETPVGEWGFNNLEEMDNRILQIKGYSIGEGEDYVYVSRADDEKHNIGSLHAFRFENGYVYDCNTKIKKDDYSFDEDELYKGVAESDYNIIDNDNLDEGDNYPNMSITERKTTENRDDFVAFVIDGTGVRGGSGWYVPYNFVDFDKGVFITEDSEGTSYCAMYLKDN